MASARQLYYDMLETARRQYGQLKRYVPESRLPSFEEYYKPISGKRGYSMRNVIALGKRINKAPAKFDRLKPTEEEEEKNKILFNNLINTITHQTTARMSVKAKIATDYCGRLIEDLFKRALTKYGYYTNVMEKIKSVASDYVDYSTRLVMLMYNEDYRQDGGKLNEARWSADINRLESALGVKVSPLMYESIWATLDEGTTV